MIATPAVLAACLALAASPRAARPRPPGSSSRPSPRPSPHPPYSIGQRLARLPRRRGPAARERPHLAGDAAQPQPPLGQPGDDRLHRGPEPHRGAGPAGRASTSATSPSRAAARSPATPATRPGSTPTSGSPRRRGSTSAAPSASGVSAISVLAADKRHVNANWTPSHAAILEAAARDPRVEPHLRHRAGQARDVRRAPAAATPPGCARSAPGGTTPTISTSG